jgi:hypothetical protein
MIGNFLKVVVETAKVPVDVGADIVTLGGSLCDRHEPFTVTRVKRAYRNLDRAGRE